MLFGTHKTNLMITYLPAAAALALKITLSSLFTVTSVLTLPLGLFFSAKLSKKPNMFSCMMTLIGAAVVDAYNIFCLLANPSLYVAISVGSNVLGVAIKLQRGILLHNSTSFLST